MLKQQKLEIETVLFLGKKSTGTMPLGACAAAGIRRSQCGDQAGSVEGVRQFGARSRSPDRVVSSGSGRRGAAPCNPAGTRVGRREWRLAVWPGMESLASTGDNGYGQSAPPCCGLGARIGIGHRVVHRCYGHSLWGRWTGRPLRRLVLLGSRQDQIGCQSPGLIVLSVP